SFLERVLELGLGERERLERRRELAELGELVARVTDVGRKRLAGGGLELRAPAVEALGLGRVLEPEVEVGEPRVGLGRDSVLLAHGLLVDPLGLDRLALLVVRARHREEDRAPRGVLGKAFEVRAPGVARLGGLARALMQPG